jgi:AdoMet-dependent heme synthase
MAQAAAQYAAKTARHITIAKLRKSPLIAFYEITRACDLVCLHCRACAQAPSDPNELSPADGRRLVDQLTEFPDPPTLVITGGDPLKRSDLFSLVEYAASKSLDVGVTPSATPLVTAAALRRLRDAGMSRLAVSLDGANAQTHDAQRGVPGSYERTWDIMALAKDLQIPLQINTTLTPTNFEQLDEMAEQLARPKIVLWSVFFLVPVGRAAMSPRLTTEQYETAFDKLWGHSLRQPYLIKTTEAPHFRRFVLRKLLGGELRDVLPMNKRQSLLHRMTVGTNDGKGILFVSHVGLIHPSGFLPLVCGLFPFHDLDYTYQKSPIFRRLRDAARLQGKCKFCEYRQTCGGSRARTYAVTGNLDAQDPDCEYIPAAMVS